jgi:DNA-binding CsgD family transcriptional regulator
MLPFGDGGGCVSKGRGRDAQRVREIQQWLQVVRLDTGSSLSALVAPLRELLGGTSSCIYGLRQYLGQRHHVSFRHSVGLEELGMATLFPAFLGANDVRWGSYNPSRPEPNQRNRVVSSTPSELAELPLARALYGTIGLGGHDQLRVLICEGPSLLAWVGAWQPGGFEARQRAMLAALVPDLRRRLAVERQLGQADPSASIDAALEAIGRAAFVVASSGRVLEANTAARALLDQDGKTTRAELVAAVTKRADHPRWAVTRARAEGRPDELLVLERSCNAHSLAARVASAASRWSLTHKQREVLARVAEGNANQTIAAILGVSERTVEVHVSALLEKAQAENRSQLVAKVHGAR